MGRATFLPLTSVKGKKLEKVSGEGIIGIASFLLGILPDPLIAIKISVISGTLGCFIDSILGAVLERRHYINNEHVNLLATICGAIIGIVSVM